MGAELRQTLVDHASEFDGRDIALNRVGIRDLQYPIRVLDKQGKTQSTVAMIGAYVSLPAHQRGTHMSRLVDSIHRHQGEMTIRRLPDVLSEIRKKLDAPSVELHLAFPYFIEKEAPVSQVSSLMNYQIDFRAELSDSGFAFSMEVEIPVKSLCPCSKGISDRGAHNQRSKVSVKIRGSAFIWIEDIVEAVEAQASAPLFALLKREDEKYVTELAYDQAKFAEDLARDALKAIRAFDGLSAVDVVVENHESIHNHQAFAEVNWSAVPDPLKRDNQTFQVGQTPLHPESFGQWLRSMRESRCIAQSRLAKQLEITPSHLSKIEADLRSPSVDLIEVIARVLGVSSAVLYLRAGRLPPRLCKQASLDPQGLLARLES
jgi:GTP cyclohydrolase IB